MIELALDRGAAGAGAARPGCQSRRAGAGDLADGRASLQLNGQAFHLHIQALKAMAQPLGSFFDWGLNINGQWGRSPADLKASVAVLDQGFNTLDLFHLAKGQIVRRYTGGETLGQRRAAKVMQDLLLQKAGRRFSLHEADEIIRHACTRGTGQNCWSKGKHSI